MSSYLSSDVSSGAGYEGTHAAAYAFGREPLYPVLVVEEVHVEWSEQRRGQVFEIQPGVYISLGEGGPQEPENGRAAPIVRGMREALQAVSPAQRFVAAVEEIQVLRGEDHEPVHE